MASTVDPNLKIFKILNLHLKRQRYVFIWNINLPNNSVPASSEKMDCRMIRPISVSHFSDCIRILWIFSKLPQKVNTVFKILSKSFNLFNWILLQDNSFVKINGPKKVGPLNSHDTVVPGTSLTLISKFLIF